MNDLLAAIELETAPNPDAAVIWMHGLGADGGDFVPIVPELHLPATLAVRFVFPHAPQRPVTINGGMWMRAWYDIAVADLQRLPDQAGIEQSAAQITALMQRENERGVTPARTILAGFSQGGVIALHTALRHAERLAGVLALSTYLAVPERLAAEAHAANRGLPILYAHGTYDPLISLKQADDSRTVLEQNGYPVQWHTYPMEHSVCAQEIAQISDWIQAKLA